MPRGRPRKNKVEAQSEHFCISHEEEQSNRALQIHEILPVSPEQQAEIKARAFYLVARLKERETDEAVEMLVRGFQLTEKKARLLMRQWKQQTIDIAENSDRRWLRDEMALVYEISQCRSMLLDSVATTMADTQSLSESRKEQQFRLALGQSIVELSGEIGQLKDEELEVKDTHPAIMKLLDTADRLDKNQSISLTQTITVNNNE